MTTRIILSATQKGGAGKTTLATNLAGTLPGKVALFDIDPQRTAAEVWGAARTRNNLEMPVAFPVKFDHLGDFIQKARQLSFDWIVVDTIPASDEAILEAARHAEMILLPTKPNIADIMALKTTIGLLARFQAPKFVVMNEVTWTGRWLTKLDKPREAVEAIGGIPAPFHFGSRRCFPDAMAYGLTVPEHAPRNAGAAEVIQLTRFVTEQMAA